MPRKIDIGERTLLTILQSWWLKLLIAILLYFVFRLPCEATIKTLLIDPVFSKIKTSVYTDTFLIILLFVWWLFVAYSIIRRRHGSEISFATVAGIISIYTFYRFEGKWNFEDFSIANGIHYFDSLYVIFAFQVIQWIVSNTPRKQKDPNSELGFEIDEPITNSSLDLYGRKQFAESIAKKICADYNSQNSIAIAIDGPWGSGKTSFVHMIKEHIETIDQKENTVFVDFHPWKSTTPQQIITDFFSVFTDAIENFSGSLSRKISHYSKSLTKIDDNILSKTIDVLIDVIESEKSKESQYEEINNELSRIQKKIIVIIDDLDRLDKKEIIEVIRLVRNTAKFANTFFIVTYEREYVLNAVKHLNEHKFKQYLEKIFLFEFSLPFFERTILKTELKNIIVDKLNEEHKTTFTTCVDWSPLTIVKRRDFFTDIIKTKRDVVRYSNSFLFDYARIKDEINIKDFAILQLLKLKYPDILELIYEKMDLFFSTPEAIKDRSLGLEFKLKSNEGEPLLKTYLNEDNCNSIKYDRCEIEEIVALVSNLISSTDHDFMTTQTDPKSITIIDNFYKYFANRVFEGEISIAEFNTEFNADETSFLKKIDFWLEKGYQNDVMIRLSRTKPTDLPNAEQFEKLILGIFHFTAKTSIAGSRYLFNTEQLYEILYQKKEYPLGVINKLYHGDEERYLQFLKNLFLRANPPFGFESWFIRIIKERHAAVFVLPVDFLLNCQISYLQKYLNAASTFDRNAWSLIFDTKLEKSIEAISPELRASINQQLRTLVTDFISEKQLLDEFLGSLLRYEPFDEVLFGLNFDAIRAIFGNMETFENYLVQQKEKNSSSNYIGEFLTFFFRLKQNQFTKYITFDFLIMPLPKKRDE